MTAAHSDSEYLRNRRLLLKDKPACHWCGTAKATTADHLIEVDRGGTHDLDNLVPACKPCNSRRGAQYVNGKRARTNEARAKATGTTAPRGVREPAPRRSRTDRDTVDAAPVLGEAPSSTPRPFSSVSPRRTRTGTDRPGDGRTEADPEASGPIGRPEPRLETPRLGGESYGPLVAAWSSRVLRIDLMDWQCHALGGQLERHGIDGDGYGLRHRLSLVSTSRQQGKTVALKALIGWWLDEMTALRGEPQTVLSTAHRLDLAVDLFAQLAPVLVDLYGATAKWSYGRNEVVMPSGSRWIVQAAGPSAGHGKSPDLIVADEIWDISEDCLDQGLIPSQRARRSPLLSTWSTAGTDGSRVMLRLREEAIRAIDAGRAGRLYMAEWSLPPGVDPMDSRWWGWANPALGTTIDLETLEAESQTPNRAAFLRASLNLWVSSDQGWIPPGVWDELLGPESAAAGGVLSLETSVDESRYSGVLARADDGIVTVSAPVSADSLPSLWDQAGRLLDSDPRLALTVTPSLELSVPPQYGRRTSTVGYAELVKHTQTVRAMILEGRLRHTGQAQLAEHVNRAVAVRTNGGLVLSSQRSPGPIELARSMVWSAALASRPTWSTKPALGRSRT